MIYFMSNRKSQIAQNFAHKGEEMVIAKSTAAGVIRSFDFVMIICVTRINK